MNPVFSGKRFCLPLKISFTNPTSACSFFRKFIIRKVNTQKELPLALTCGDPSGIGPEIIAKHLADNPQDAVKLVAVGPQRWLETLPCPGIAVGDRDFKADAGKPDASGQRIALEAMERAAAGTLAGEFAGVVTAPVNKAGLQSIGYRFPGQTEFFADRWGGTPVMAFVGEKMRVVLATWHIPFRDVPEALTPETLENALNAADFLATKFDSGRACPQIGVCGLNPHAGEKGILGTEERDKLDPALDKLRERFPGVSNCIPADTIFCRHLRGEFDVVVGLYHDQALAPLKTLEFDTAVNVSLGLRHIRTSPDHGTAYDIAGKNIARADSFGNAVRVALRLCGK